MRKLFILALLVFCLAPTLAQDEVMTFEPSENQVLDLALSPLEDQFATISRSQTGQEQYSDPVLEIFSIETGEILTTLEEMPVRALYNPDGTQFFVTLQSGEAILLDTETLEEVVRVESLTAYLESGIQFSADGSQLMVQGTSLSVYNAENLTLLYEVDSPSGEFIGHSSYSPDGSQIALTDWASMTYILDAETGEVVTSFDSAIEFVNYFAWLSDNTMVQGDMGRGIAVLDAETGEVLASYELEFFVRAVVARDEYLLIATGDNEVILWQPASDEIVETFAFDTYRWARQLAIGETLIFANEDQLVFATEYALPEEE